MKKMASNDTRYDNLVELVQKLFQSHKQLEEKHEKLKKEVNTLRLQMASSSCTNCSRRNPTDHANASPNSEHHGAAHTVNVQPHQPQHKPGNSSATYDSTIATHSPVQLNSDPPKNVQRPFPRNTHQFDEICKAVKSRRHLLCSDQPQESDYINVLRRVGVEVNPATIAAVSSASQGARGLIWNKPGLYTVLILDISKSMTEQGFILMQKFVDKLLKGMDSTKKECGLYEYVSLITCGGITSTIQPFTNDYRKLMDIIGRLILNGRTPLLTALTLALCYLELHGENVMLESYNITPRLIVVSDFEVSTDKQPFDGDEGDVSEERIQIQNKLFKFARTQCKPLKYNITCVPVGNCNVPVVKEFASNCGGTVVNSAADVQNTAYFYRYQISAGCAINEYERSMEHGVERDINELVKEAMTSVHLNSCYQNDVMRIVNQHLDDNEDQFVNDIEEDARFSSRGQTPLTGQPVQPVQRSQPEAVPDLPDWHPRTLDNISFEEMIGLPSIGTRVIRGKDWIFGDKDNNGPGTIVGHKARGILYVLWDHDQIDEYRYGLEGKYDVQKCNDSRIVAPEQIEIGCCIIRGPDWDRDDEDGGVGTVGTVVRKLRGRFVNVRWPSRVIETYRFGAQNKWDIQIVEPGTHSIAMGTQLFDTGAQTDAEAEAAQSLSNTVPESHLPPSASSDGPLRPWWSWEDSSKQWRSFSEEDVRKLENKLNLGQNNCLVNYMNKRVKVSINNYQCEINGRNYRIKREMLKQEDIDSRKSIENFLQPLD